jgi:hypothetical protein
MCEMSVRKLSLGTSSCIQDSYNDYFVQDGYDMLLIAMEVCVFHTFLKACTISDNLHEK